MKMARVRNSRRDLLPFIPVILLLAACAVSLLKSCGLVHYSLPPTPAELAGSGD